MAELQHDVVPCSRRRQHITSIFPLGYVKAQVRYALALMRRNIVHPFKFLLELVQRCRLARGKDIVDPYDQSHSVIAFSSLEYATVSTESLESHLE